MCATSTLAIVHVMFAFELNLKVMFMREEDVINALRIVYFLVIRSRMIWCLSSENYNCETQRFTL